MANERATERPTLERQFELLLSKRVRPFLRADGFTKANKSFRRSRGSLYDMIGFQANWHNGVTPSHGYFVNVGIGSAEVDAVWPGPRPQPPNGFLFDRRWESVVPELPYEIRFNHTTDMSEFADALCEGLGRVVAVLDEFDCTSTLVRHAVDHNLLIQYERTCCYLAAIGDVDTLTEYVGLLHDRFGHQDRWAIFNREISRATGALTSTLVGLGLLDPVEAPR